MSKTFTLDEAHILLPTLGALLTRARDAAVRAAQVDHELQMLSQRIFLSGGLHVDVAAVAQRRAEREKAMSETRCDIAEIEQIGARIAELEDGGLEFPFLLEGRTVLLSWSLGEEAIHHWREEAEGADLQELDWRFRRDRERPN